MCVFDHTCSMINYQHLSKTLRNGRTFLPNKIPINFGSSSQVVLLNTVSRG